MGEETRPGARGKLGFRDRKPAAGSSGASLGRASSSAPPRRSLLPSFPGGVAVTSLPVAGRTWEEVPVPAAACLLGYVRPRAGPPTPHIPTEAPSCQPLQRHGPPHTVNPAASLQTLSQWGRQAGDTQLPSGKTARPPRTWLPGATYQVWGPEAVRAMALTDKLEITQGPDGCHRPQCSSVWISISGQEEG